MDEKDEGFLKKTGLSWVQAPDGLTVLLCHLLDF